MIGKMNFKRSRWIVIVVGVICLLVCLAYLKLIYYKEFPKAKIITSFNENIEKYERIQQYLEKNEGDFNFSYRKGHLVVKNGDRAIDINKLPIKDEVLYLVHKLHVSDINEDKGFIYFTTHSPSGTSGKGIVYLNSESYEKFKSVQQYVEKREGGFYLANRFGDLTVGIEGKDIDINKMLIKDELLYLVNNLNIIGIHAYEDNFYFSTYVDSHHSQQVRVDFNKASEGKLQNGTDCIKPGWYYYYELQME